VGWPKEVPYLESKARDEYNKSHWPMTTWPKSMPYPLPDSYEKRFPRAEGHEGVPFLDSVTLAAHVGNPNAESEQVGRTSGSGIAPSQVMRWRISKLSFMHRQETMYPLPGPHLNDRFLVELFKKRRQDAAYQAEVAKKDVVIMALKRFITQYEHVKLLLGQS
jgi:hypothetical protein